MPLNTPQRTTDHVIADLSANHVERLFLLAGHSPASVPRDYGYDMTVTTHGSNGFVESGVIYIQLKASRRLKRKKGTQSYAFSITRKHYNLWRDEPMPVYLIRYCRKRDVAYWLYLQPYFKKNPTLFRNSAQKTATILIPAQNRMTLKVVKEMQKKKQEAVRAANQAIDHQD